MITMRTFFITESCLQSQVWHLVRHDSDSQKDSERSNKLVSEIYLTRYFHLHHVPHLVLFTFIRYFLLPLGTSLKTFTHSPWTSVNQTLPGWTDLVWIDRQGSERCNEWWIANSPQPPILPILLSCQFCQFCSTWRRISALQRCSLLAINSSTFRQTSS